MKVLLQSLVVPHLEYPCPVWCPFDKAQICMLENVQRRFTSRIAQYQSWDTGSPVCTVNYWDRLSDLRIYSLQRRRERLMILYAYRVFIGLISFPLIDAHEAGTDWCSNRVTTATLQHRFEEVDTAASSTKDRKTRHSTIRGRITVHNTIGIAICIRNKSPPQQADTRNDPSSIS